MDPVIARFLDRNGTAPVPFSSFMAFALYDEVVGFYTATRSDRTGRAGGRSGDFLTSPEVGPLFGALVAERLDREWDALGNPTEFAVVECGAGPGALARSIAFAAPRCAEALRYVMVEVSAGQRALHGDHLDRWEGEVDGPDLDAFVASSGAGPRFVSSPALPTTVTGAVLANELLDNLPFDVVRHDGRGGCERLDVVVVDGALELVPVPVELDIDEGAILASARPGAWVPLPRAARLWVHEAFDRIERGALVVLDYGATTAELAARPDMGWLRTFTGNERGGHPLDDPGAQDITADVAIDQLALGRTPTLVTTQREWLTDLGIVRWVEEGRRIWKERAAAPDLVALRARSRVGESEALLDPDGLGGFLVLEWTADGTGRREADR